MSDQKKYRLVTRSDFDGLVCAMLLKQMDMIDDILFVHPKEMQDGNVPVTDRDITTNLPYVPGAGMVFDHHSSELIRMGGEKPDNYIIDPEADSAARVVYDHFGGKERFPNVSEDIMTAVDKADAARFSDDDILYPKGWDLLSFLMDPRTGLGNFKTFTISNYDLMMALIDYCADHTVEEILALPDVKERVDLYFNQESKHRTQIQAHGKLTNNLIVLDFKYVDTVYAGNRFTVYALFPQCNISMHVLWGADRSKTVFALGKSIFNRTSKTDIGALCLEYGGGGHHGAGTCQVNNEDANRVRQELIDRITADG